MSAVGPDDLVTTCRIAQSLQVLRDQLWLALYRTPGVSPDCLQLSLELPSAWLPLDEQLAQEDESGTWIR